MKRKITIVLLSLISAICCAFGFAACVGGGNNNPTPKTVQATVNVSCDFENEDYISEFNLSFGNSGFSTTDPNTTEFTVEPHETINFDDAILKISLKKGFNPETLGVVEKDGKQFTTEYNTEKNKNDVIIKMPFAENIEYSFTLTAPEAIYKNIGFRLDDSRTLGYEANRALISLLNNTQVWVENADGEGHAGFVNLTTIENFGKGEYREFNAARYSIKADTSKQYFPVYVRFDKNDAKKVIYNNAYLSMFSFGEHDVHDVEYVQIPGTNEYAYAYYFYTGNISSTNYSVYLKGQRLKTDLSFVTGAIRTEFSVVTFNPGSSNFKIAYNFKLDCYSVDGGKDKETNDNTIEKVYGKSYKVQYSFRSITITGVNDSEKTALANKLRNATDFANIQLTINGKKLTGVESHDSGWYVYTIKADDVPYTYSGELGNEFAFNADVESVKVKSSQTNVVNVKTTKNLQIGGGSVGDAFSRFEKGDYSFIRNFYKEGIGVSASYGGAKSGKFRVDITVDGTPYTKTFTPGVDYLTAITDKTGYEAFGNADIYSFASTYYFLGEDEAANQIRCEFDNYGNIGIYTWLNDFDKTKQIDITIELTELESSGNDIAIEVAGNRFNGDFTVNGEETTVIKPDEESRLYIPLNESNDYPNYTIELYSDGVLICSTNGLYLHGYEGECKIDGYNAHWGLQFFTNYNYGGYSTTEVFIDVATSGYLFLTDSDYNVIVIKIDKIVISVNS